MSRSGGDSLDGWVLWKAGAVVAVEKIMMGFLSLEHAAEREKAGMGECRIVGNVRRHEARELVAIDIGNGEERHELLNVNTLEPVANLTDGLHIGDAGVVGFECEFAEVGDSGEKEFGMGRLKMLDESVEHGNAVGDEEIVRKEHVDVGTRDDGRIEQGLVDVVAHGRSVRFCCCPICDVKEVVIAFEGIELGEEELAVAWRAVPSWEWWAWKRIGA